MAGEPQIGYLKQIAFDDPSVTLEKEIRKVFAPMIAMKAEVETLAKELETDHSNENVKALVEGKNIVKVIAVPNKLVNIVVK